MQTIDNWAPTRQSWIPASSVQMYNNLVKAFRYTGGEWVYFGLCEFVLLNPDEVRLYKRVQELQASDPAKASRGLLADPVELDFDTPWYWPQSAQTYIVRPREMVQFHEWRKRKSLANLPYTELRHMVLTRMTVQIWSRAREMGLDVDIEEEAETLLDGASIMVAGRVPKELPWAQYDPKTKTISLPWGAMLMWVDHNAWPLPAGFDSWARQNEDPFGHAPGHAPHWKPLDLPAPSDPKRTQAGPGGAAPRGPGPEPRVPNEPRPEPRVHVTTEDEIARSPQFWVVSNGKLVGKGALAGFPAGKVHGELVSQHQLIELHAGTPTAPQWNVRWRHSEHINARVIVYGQMQVRDYSEESMLSAVMAVLGVQGLRVALYLITPQWRGLNQA